mmetsp:Transcript_63451/g.138180  ORF Transcript_63451/g.138180 Transcript_63451/m.138180 type:complete len:378 (+) Transcript_63451:32-1165(+)
MVGLRETPDMNILSQPPDTEHSAAQSSAAQASPQAEVVGAWQQPAAATNVVTTPAADEASPQLQPLHRVWPAQNTFSCRGVLMMGGESGCRVFPNVGWAWANCFNWFCILSLSSIYFIFVLPYFWSKFIFLPLISVTLFFFAVSFLCLACFSDPGIIPRREVILATQSDEMLTEILGYSPLGEGEPAHVRATDAHQMVPPHLAKMGYRWCYTCEIVRPPRASHCPDCDNCVLRFDHHCPFVNNCVGQRNYHFFMGFVTSVLCLAALVLPSIAWFFIEDLSSSSWSGVPVSSTTRLVLICAACLAGLVVLMLAGLWLYHLYLIAHGKTTREHWKGQKQEQISEEPSLSGPRGPQLFNQFALVDITKVRRAHIQPEGDP